MGQTYVSCHSSAARLRVRDGVLRATVTGALTVSTLAVLQRAIGAAEFEVGLVDLSTALVALSSIDLGAAQAAGLEPRPMAILVGPALVDAFCGYAWEAAQSGIVRRVFTAPAAAQAWARRQAAVRVAQGCAALRPRRTG